ncbi:MAG: class I SAM-dependent methyltransferase [Spongiibacteraceae bacterium]
MNDYDKLPAFDDSGINLADPNDTLGRKTAYISMLQAKALQQYVGFGTGKALDIGCGYGRMSDALADLGYLVTGVEPSERVLKAASVRRPEHEWCVGQMPNLPFPDNSFDLVCLFNVARALHLMNVADVCESISRLVKPGGRLIVIDNLRRNDSRYLPENWFNETFSRDGLCLSHRVAIRASRWPVIYMIRYGLIPLRWFSAIANWELQRMVRKKQIPRHSYYNYLFIYEKK